MNQYVFLFHNNKQSHMYALSEAEVSDNNEIIFEYQLIICCVLNDVNKNNINKCDYLQRLSRGSNLCSPVNICTMDLKIIRAITEVTSNKNIPLYTRR